MFSSFNLHSHADGSYREHGREIFDEEAETTSKDKKGKAKKPVSVNRLYLIVHNFITLLLQGMPKRVAKPTSNIKHMLLSNAGSSSKKKKQV